MVSDKLLTTNHYFTAFIVPLTLPISLSISILDHYLSSQRICLTANG